MPTTSGTLEYAKTAVDDATQLAGVDATAMDDGSLAFLRVTGKFYHLVRTSTASPDGTSVIVTKSGVGRWLVGPTANDLAIAVPTEAALSLVGVSSLLDGTFAWVGNPAGGLGQAQGSTWQLVTQVSGLPALAAHLVIASATPGRVWQRQVNLFNQKWVQSTGWFVGGAGADDQNDGQTGASPIATGAELARRMAKQSVGRGLPVTVTLLGSIADDLDFTGVLGTILVTAATTTIASGTLNASTGINRAANTFQTIGTAAFDFTPHLKKKIKLTSGAANIIGAESWIDSIPGANQAITSAFTTQAGGPFSGSVAVVTPAGNETFNIVTTFTFRKLITDSFTSAFSPIVVALENVTPTTQDDGFRSGFLLLNRIDLSVGLTRFLGSCFGFALGCQHAFTTFAECGSGSFAAAHFTGPIVGNNAEGASILQFSQDCMFSDVTISTNNVGIRLDACGWRNTTAAKKAIDCTTGVLNPPAAKIVIVTALYGTTNNGIGVQTGKFTTIDGGGVTPTLNTGAAVNIQFGSASKTWAQLPFVDQYNVGAGAVANANMAGWL